MRLLWLVFQMRMKRQLAYRTAAYAGIVTQVVFGLVLVAIFAAFYANGIKAPMTLPQVITYIWLGQAFFAMTPYSVFPDAELREQIRDGSVATELLRPVDLHSLWMARTLASKLAPTALRCAPVIVVATLFAGMQLPPDIPSFLAWLLTTIGALVLISAFIVLMILTQFWTVAGDGLSRAVPGIAAATSGQLVPLALLPENIRMVFEWLPFSGMVDKPYAFWVGTRPVSDLPFVLGHQLLWTVVLVAAGRLILGRGLRRLTVTGG